MTSRIEHLAEGVTLYLGDCREILPVLRPIDLLMTSPPYASQRNYISFSGDEYESILGALSQTPSNDKTQILVNLGLVHKDGYLVEYWDSLKRDMKKSGWRLFGMYVWDQGPGMPGDWAGRLAPAHEFIFHFNKTPRKPNKTVSSNYAGYIRSKPQGGIRKPDGSMSGWSHGLEPTQESKIPDSVIRVTRHKHTGGIEAGHPAVFPIQLPEELILAYSDRDEFICDPFLGSGTTGIASVKTGRKFIGIEIEPKYFDIACRRISDALKQPDMFIEKPKPAVQEAFEL